MKETLSEKCEQLNTMHTKLQLLNTELEEEKCLTTELKSLMENQPTQNNNIPSNSTSVFEQRIVELEERLHDTEQQLNSKQQILDSIPPNEEHNELKGEIFETLLQRFQDINNTINALNTDEQETIVEENDMTLNEEVVNNELSVSSSSSRPSISISTTPLYHSPSKRPLSSPPSPRRIEKERALLFVAIRTRDQTIGKLNKNIQTLTNSLSTSELSNDSLKIKMNMLINELSELRTIIEQYETNSTHLSSSPSSGIEKLKKQNNDLQIEIQEFKQIFDTQSHTITLQSEQINELNNKIIEYEKEMKYFQNALTKSSIQLKEHEEALKGLATDHRKLRKAYNAERKERVALQAKAGIEPLSPLLASRSHSRNSTSNSVESYSPSKQKIQNNV
jgi:chromosome segregation ATPase